MVRLLRYTIITVLLPTLLLLGTGSWVLYSQEGTSWLLQKLPEWTETELTFGEIEGTLGGTLQLKNIKLYLQEEQISLDHLAIENQLTGLVPLTLEINQLQAENLQIKSISSEAAFSWSNLPWPLDLLHINLNDVKLQNSSWQEDNEEPWQIDLLRGDLQLENGTLHSKNVHLQNGELLGNGSFSCNLQQPGLKVELQLKTDDSTSVWQHIELKTDLREGSGKEILHGSIATSLTVAEGERLTAVSELALTAEQLQLRQLTLTRPDHSGIITADVELDFGGAVTELSGQLQLDQVDLQEETGEPLNLSGTVQIEGTLDTYSGKFSLKNPGTGVSDAQLTGNFTGTLNDLSLENLYGEWLSGIVSGQAHMGWEQGWQLTTQLSGKDIDPQQLDPQLDGRLNLDLQADFNGDDEELFQGNLQLKLHDSILHNYPLSGFAELQLQDNSLQIKQLHLQGEGIQLQASGNPEEKLTFNWQVKNMEHLLINTTGQFSGQGWLRWRQQALRLVLQASGENLTFEEWQLNHLSLQADIPEDQPIWQLQLDGQTLHNSQLDLDIEKVSIELEGDLDSHQLTLSLTQQKSHASARIRGSWDGHQWQGELSNIQVTDSPFGNWNLQQAVPILLSAEQLSVEAFSLRSDHDSDLQLEGNYHLKQQQGTAGALWHNLDLSIFDPLIAEWNISGQSDGSLKLERGQKNLLHAEITTSGEIKNQQLDLKLEHSEILFNWDESGLNSSLHITLADNSTFQGNLISPQKNNFIWPQHGKVQLSAAAIPLDIIRPWLPEELDIDGTLDLDGHGEWQATEPLNLVGSATIYDGALHWKNKEQTNGVKIDSAELNWQWQQNLKGELSIKLQNHGRIKTTFDLPLTAQLPLSFDTKAPINIDLHSDVQELGLLSIYFPEYFEKSRGQAKLDLQLTGSWQQPNLAGKFHLFNSEIFLSTVGIRLSDIELQGNVSGTHIEVVKLQCSSGGGELSGTGSINIQDWFPATYHLQLQGENFQLINHPELQVTVTPDLSIDGTEEVIKVRGEIKLPKVKVDEQQEAGTITNSPDLKITDIPSKKTSNRKLKHDIDIELILGKRVFISTVEVDARLGGKLHILSNKKQELIGYGKFYVIRGTYFKLGANLNINYGNLLFTGGPIDQPELDILALRRISEVEVGAKVTGTPQTPDLQLYSRPIMPEGDILSYLLTGQPMSASRSQTNLLVSGISALFPRGKSRGMMNQLGLDTFYISTDYEEGSGEDGTTVITTGKYLNPDLYLSVGYSPDSDDDRIKVRYRLTPVWEIESTVGYDSGADIFYRIEFD